MRASAARTGDQYRDVQSKLAAEVAAHSADRLLLAELRPEAEQLTSTNHKLTAALAVAQLQAAVGVDALLSEVIVILISRCTLNVRHFFQAGFSSLSSKTPEQQASFLSKAKVRECFLLRFRVLTSCVIP